MQHSLNWMRQRTGSQQARLYGGGGAKRTLAPPPRGQ